MNTLICATILMVNISNDPWNDHDKKILKRAKYVCSLEKDTPCVKKFIKTEKLNFHVICGGKNEKSN